MSNETRFTMVSPAAGFTSRVMARLAEREHAQARQRAMIGSALLVVAAIIIVALIVLWLVSWVAVIVATPQAIVSVLDACGTLAFWLGVALNAFGVAVVAVADSIGTMTMITLAVTVCALTGLWLRVVAGPSFASQTIHVGGSR